MSITHRTFYGVTVPSLLADQGMGAETSTAGGVGSVVGLGMIVGAVVAMQRAGSSR